MFCAIFMLCHYMCMCVCMFILCSKKIYSIKHIHNLLTTKKTHTLTDIILHQYKYIHIHKYICLLVNIYIYICTYLYSKLPILRLTKYVKPNNSMSRQTPPANFTPNEPINLQTKPKHKRD